MELYIRNAGLTLPLQIARVPNPKGNSFKSAELIVAGVRERENIEIFGADAGACAARQLTTKCTPGRPVGFIEGSKPLSIASQAPCDERCHWNSQRAALARRSSV